jgi:hypothetical protein
MRQGKKKDAAPCSFGSGSPTTPFVTIAKGTDFSRKFGESKVHVVKISGLIECHRIRPNNFKP